METKRKSAKVVVSVLALAALVVFSLMVYAGDLEPSAPPGPTMKTLDEVEPRIAIQSLNSSATGLYVVDEPGSYYLTGNIFINFKHGIEIGVSNVTVDLMGYEIRSSWDIKNPGPNLNFDGIYITPGNDNVEIRNGSIFSNNSSEGGVTYNGFRHGIYAADSEGVYCHRTRVIDVRVAGSRENGIRLRGTNNIVKGCSTEGNEYGISTGNNSLIVGNTVKGSRLTGILPGKGSIVRGNASTDCLAHGIFCGENCIIEDNVARGNAGGGIVAFPGSIVSGNVVAGNGNFGIDTYSNCKVSSNNAYNNGSDGISVRDYCIVSDNTVYSNNGYGIKAGHDCSVTGNNTSENTGYGIYCGDGTSLINNTASGNSGGMHTGYGSSIIGNTARSNGIYGIHVPGDCLVNNNTAFNNTTNIYAPSSTMGINHAP